MVRQREWGSRESELGGEVSGIVTGTLIHYLKDTGGENLLARFVEQARLSDAALRNLQDPSCWVTAVEAATLFKHAQQLLRNPLIGRDVGSYHMRPHEPYGVADALVAAGREAGPVAAYQVIDSVIPRYASHLTLRKMEVGRAHAIMALNSRPGFGLDLQLCYFIQGVLGNLPVIFGLVPGVVTESECIARGGRFCLYSVAWEQGQWSEFVATSSSLLATAWDERNVKEPEARIELSPEEKIRSLEDQVNSLTMRLENVYSTASELLAFADLDTILRNIIRRAGRTVNAKRYLLIARTSPEKEPAFLAEGLSEEEASRLAQVFVSGTPPSGDHILTIPIRSSRMEYGYLVAFNPEGVRFLEQDKKMLQLYADYSATALDVATALDKEHRSNETARTLLEFARRLSGAQSKEEVGHHLAQTALQVLGAAGAVVLLRNEDEGSFVEISRALLPELAGSVPKPPVVIEAEFAQAILRAARVSEPFILRAEQDPRVQAMLGPWGVRAILVTPLSLGSEAIGALVTGFGKRLEANPRIDEDTRERSLGLASQAVTALMNVERTEQIRHMATHDALTGLANRRYFDQRLAEEIKRSDETSQPLTLFFIDLDRFKQINDTFGHAAGDELIRQVAHRLSQAVRGQDLVARLGGDEFAIIVPGLSDKDLVRRLAERLLNTLRQPFFIEGRQIYTSGSIGISTKEPGQSLSFDDLVREADTAMYHSKSQGRNSFTTWGEDIAESTASSAALADEIPRAMQAQEFEVVYQFQLDQNTMAIVGVEALLRWNHREKGTLLPSQFLPAAERSGLITTLDSWVLEKAVSQLVSWEKEGYVVPRVCINVSVQDLIGGALLSALKSVLNKYAVEPSRIEIEIPQSDVQKNAAQIADAVKDLKALGVRVAVDNLGAKEMELATLRAYRFDTFKLDNVVTEGIAKAEESVIDLLDKAERLAKESGAQLVAEGVETESEKEATLARGVTVGQGFFYSPPYDAAKATAALKAKFSRAP